MQPQGCASDAPYLNIVRILIEEIPLRIEGFEQLGPGEAGIHRVLLKYLTASGKLVLRQQKQTEQQSLTDRSTQERRYH